MSARLMNTPEFLFFWFSHHHHGLIRDDTFDSPPCSHPLLYPCPRVLLISLIAQSFRPDYHKLGLKPKKTPLLVAKKVSVPPIVSDPDPTVCKSQAVAMHLSEYKC